MRTLFRLIAMSLGSAPAYVRPESVVEVGDEICFTVRVRWWATEDDVKLAVERFALERGLRA